MKPWRVRPLNLPLMLAALAMFATAPVSAQCQYTVEVIQAPYCAPFGYPATIGVALNSQGDVVGSYPSCVIGPDRAFLWTPEAGFQTLPLPPGVTSMRANGINDSRVIVGGMHVNGLGNRGFIYEDGAYTILSPMFDTPGTTCSISAINNAGMVSGDRGISKELTPTNAFVWSKDTGYIDLGLMGYETSSYVSDITDAGEVIGDAGSISHGEAFIWTNGKLELLGIPPGAFSSDGAGAGAGMVAGSYLIPGPVAYPAIWTPHNGWVSLGLLPECTRGYAKDISERTGVIVGPCSNDSSDRFPFVWYGTQLYNLNDLANSGDDIERPFAINEVGQIIADGHAGGTVTFLLTPIAPSPADTNGDCDTDFDDFTFLLSSWGLDEPRADFDQDGIVVFDDFVFLLAHWTTDP